MKTIIIFFVICLLSYNCAFSQTVTIEKIPTSVEEFIQLRDNVSQTVEGGAAIFLLALKIYNENPELGEKCLVNSVDKNTLRKGETYKGFSLFNNDRDLLKKQLSYNKNIPNSYIKGASPENNYTVKLPFIYEFSGNNYSGDKNEGIFKIYVNCSGADSKRPMSMKKNDKVIWKVSTWSSIVVGIKKSKKENTDDL